MPFTFLKLWKSRSLNALTVFGWTPGLRWLVASRTLDCGCKTGVYETWAGGRALIIDHRALECGDPFHRRNAVIDIV